MADQPRKPSRRWFQFSLRTLLIAVTLVAALMLVTGLLVVWRAYDEPYRRQREAMKLIEELGGSYKAEPGGPSWMRDWFGVDNFQHIVLVDLADCDYPEKYLGHVASLPRLETLVVGGRGFTDEHLSRLKRLKTLSGLVLDSTDVSNDGIGALKGTLPELVIHKSQRRSIIAFKRLGDVKMDLHGTLPQLQRLVGDEYFEDAVMVSLLSSKVADFGLAHLKEFRNLRFLDLGDTQVSDTGPHGATPTWESSL